MEFYSNESDLNEKKLLTDILVGVELSACVTLTNKSLLISSALSKYEKIYSTD